MTDAGFARLQQLFDAASELPDAQQADYARRHCGDDPALLADLLRLLERERRDAGIEPGFDALDRTLRDALPELARERTVGPYTLHETIGSGGMGRVYRARRTEGDVEHDVALKLIRAEAVDGALLRRFSTEKRTLAALNHPGICRFLDAGTTIDGTPYVAMELIRGRPLLEYCDERSLAIVERLQLFRRVLAAVGHAHRQLVVHRDIKSSNVLVDDDGAPKLLDFGIAKSLADHGHAPTATAERFFTPANAAPEQLLGEFAGIGCDIYALGALAFELLCGRPPFDFAGLRAGAIERLLLEVPPPLASTRAATANADVVQRRGLRSARALSQTLAGDLDAILARCLRKAPAERYQSIAELDDDIASWLENRPLRARRGERLYRARKFVARHRIAVIVIALLAAFLVDAWVGAGLLAIRMEDERNRAVAERDRAQQAIGLLKDAFLSADPARSGGAGVDVRLRDVLRATRPRLDALYDTQPALYAEMAGTLADVEFALGDRRGAGELAARAADAASRAGASPATVHRLFALGALGLAAVNDVPRARALLQRARTVEPEDSALADVAQGLIHRNSAAYEDAVSMLRRAVQRMVGASPSDELALYARWQLAEALRTNEQYEAALAEHERTLAWLRATLEEDHPNILRTRMRHGESLRQVGRIDDAIAELDAVGAAIERLYGSDSAFAAQLHGVLAQALVGAKQPQQALQHQRLSVAASEVALGELHANTRRGLLNLAMLVADTPDGAGEADALYARAVALSDRAEGSGSNIALYVRINHASLLLRERRYDAALRTLVPPGGALTFGPHVDARNRTDYLAALRQSADGAGCTGLRAQRPDLSSHCAAARTMLGPAHAEP